MNEDADYTRKTGEQVEQYASVELLHSLPPIRGYWVDKYITPRVETVFYSERAWRGNFYADFFEDVIVAAGGAEAKFLSLGAGDCKHEIALVKNLKERKVSRFTLECVELSEQLLDIGRQTAKKEGISDQMVFSNVDVNKWKPTSNYDAVMAHHALHHFVNLEGIFSRVSECIGKSGIFMTCDVIGRNGHRLWPEVLQIVESLWSSLPSDKKFHHQLKKHCETFLDHDCSTRGFEGIRAQDILPLLVANLQFEYFLGYGGLTDVFVLRSFGHNWRIESTDDRAFIDAVQLMNDTLCDIGYIKPTRMMALLRHPSYSGPCKYYRHWSPEFCQRIPN